MQSVPVKLNPVNDTTSTTSEGKYLFKSLIPGDDYKIEVSKPPYSKGIRNNVAVTSANTTEINFALHRIQYPRIYPKYLDFGSDSILKSFTITNTGTGKLTYFLNASQDWITVSPKNGEATTETDTIKVTINRTGLSDKKHLESIEVDSYVGQDILRDSVGVYLNGIFDCDTNYYSIVTIGTQTWLAENLNTGVRLGKDTKPADNGLIEKYCYGDNKANCTVYGGLYSWSEMMQYRPPDEGIIGTTQGVCPVGWHIPTYQEWSTLIIYLGGPSVAGGKLKETGFTHWLSPNTEATNESGFTALAGGALGYETDPDILTYLIKGTQGLFGTSRSGFDHGIEFNTCTVLSFDKASVNKDAGTLIDKTATSIRCIKDPPKNK